MNLITTISLLLLITIGIALLHEALHILATRMVGWRAKITPTPLMIKVDLYTPTRCLNKIPFKNLAPIEKSKYNRIAIAPYIILLPMGILLFLQGNLIMWATGATILLSHTINLPLEWVIN